MIELMLCVIIAILLVISWAISRAEKRQQKRMTGVQRAMIAQLNTVQSGVDKIIVNRML